MLSFFYSLHRTSYTKRAWQDVAFHTSWKKKWDGGKLNRLTEKKNMAHFVAISLTEHDTLREGTQTNYASDAW